MVGLDDSFDLLDGKTPVFEHAPKLEIRFSTRDGMHNPFHTYQIV